MEWILINLFDYIDWCRFTLSHMDSRHLFFVYLSFLMIDTPRYIISKVFMLIYDLIHEIFSFKKDDSIYCSTLKSRISDIPFVSVLCPGKDEELTMCKTIESLLEQDYPCFEILVIDDGSTDRTWEVLQKFVQHPKIKLYKRQIAGGKSSAANMGLNLSVKGDIIVIVDADSEYSKNALTEMIKSFRDPAVGAVSANLRVTNWNKNLITRFQAIDYIHSISLGRRFTSWIGTLAICSGAFGAFRREAVERIGGWDVGPGEDGDLTIKIRKIGYKIKFAPSAVCYTNVPDTWKSWWKQRRRWNRGLVRYKLRKHIDMAFPWSDSYSLTNMLVIADVFFFRIFLCYSFFIYFISAIILTPAYIPLILGLTFLAYCFSNLIIMVIQLYYSLDPWEDFKIMSASFINYPYKFIEKAARFTSITEEFLLRKSYEDSYVPKRVGKATIHW